MILGPGFKAVQSSGSGHRVWIVLLKGSRNFIRNMGALTIRIRFGVDHTILTLSSPQNPILIIQATASSVLFTRSMAHLLSPMNLEGLWVRSPWNLKKKDPEPIWELPKLGLPYSGSLL